MFPNCNWISLSPHSEQHWLPISEYFQNAFNLKVWEINCHFWYVLQIWRTHTHTAHDFLLSLFWIYGKTKALPTFSPAASKSCTSNVHTSHHQIKTIFCTCHATPLRLVWRTALLGHFRSHDWPLVSSCSCSSPLLSFRCRTFFNLSITLLWNFERETAEGLFGGPALFVPLGLLGGLIVLAEIGSMDVLEAYLEFLVDMW